MACVISSTVHRYLCLLVSCLCIALAGSYFLAAIIAVDLKHEFSLTQEQVDMLVGVGVSLSNAGYIWGVLLEHIPRVLAYVGSMLVGGLMACLLYSTDYSVEFYSQYWGLIVFYWICVCSGNAASYLNSLGISRANFPLQQQGLVMGIMCASWWSGQVVFNWIYEAFSGNDNVPRVGSIFLVLACCIVVFNALAAWLVRPIPLEREEEETLIDPPSANISKADESVRETFLQTTGLYLLRRPDFHFIIWGFLLSGSTQLMFLGNISTMCASYKLEEAQSTILTVGPLFGMAMAFLSGFLSDITMRYFPRGVYLISLAAVQAVIFGVAVSYGDNYYVFFASAVLMYGNNACLFTVTSTLMGEFFGFRHFKRNWGTAVSSMALGSFAMYYFFGLYYGQAIMDTRTEDCAGTECFSYIFSVSAAMSALASLCFVLLLVIHKWLLNKKV